MSDLPTPRAFNWDDVPGLHDLVRRAQAADGVHIHLGDMYWALRNTRDGEPTSAMWVWPQDDGAFAAAAWLDLPVSADFVLAPDAPAGMNGHVLAWIESEQGGIGVATISIVARDADLARVDALRSRGYVRSEAGDLRLRRTLESEPDGAPLPDGFVLRHVADDDDIARRVEAESAAFGDTALTADRWRELASRLPHLDPELDLVVVGPDGAGAAGITCWFDEGSRRGEIEAVGTAPGVRRLGLGKAIITEGLRRLFRLGATEVALYTNIGNAASFALYRSCGFEVVAEDRAWIKTL